jgi:hypothetical protein
VDDQDPDDDAIEIALRLPRDVADRALVLGAVCRRAFLETGGDDLAADDPEGERFDLAAWLHAEGLDMATTATERHLLHARVGRLPTAAASEASWRSEALVALGWALHLLDEMPPYDAVADPTAVLEAVPTPWLTTAGWRRDARLRPEAAIATERERAELWSWRSRTADLARVAPDDERVALNAAVRDVADEGHILGLLPPPHRNDFPAHGRPYRSLTADEVADLGTVAEERLRALNWLCGFGATWDDVPLDL